MEGDVDRTLPVATEIVRDDDEETDDENSSHQQTNPTVSAVPTPNLTVLSVAQIRQQLRQQVRMELLYEQDEQQSMEEAIPMEEETRPIDTQVVAGNSQTTGKGRELIISAGSLLALFLLVICVIVVLLVSLNKESDCQSTQCDSKEDLVDEAWIQVGQSICSDDPGSQLGYSVALSSNVLAVGSIKNASDGEQGSYVRVFRQSIDAWVQMGSDIPGEGCSLDLAANGTVVAAGINDPNKQYTRCILVHSFNGSEWNQLGGNIMNVHTLDQCGYTLSLSRTGTKLAVGEAGWKNGPVPPRLRVFGLSNAVKWTQIGADLVDESRHMGHCVSMSSSGSVVATGCAADGVVRIFHRAQETHEWSQLENSTILGRLVSLSGDGTTIVVGTFSELSVFRLEEGYWTRIGQAIEIEGGQQDNPFVASVSIAFDGDTIAFGVAWADTNRSGVVEVYGLKQDAEAGEMWMRIGDEITLQSWHPSSSFGYSVSLSPYDDRMLAVGAPSRDDYTKPGCAFVYKLRRLTD